MKYETLTSVLNSQTGSAGNTKTFTLTYVNNINNISCLFFHDTQKWFRITSISFTNNVLTVVVTASSAYTTNLFLLATVASY